MTAEEKPIPKTSDWPFMCGLCHNQSPTFEQFYQHLQTHDIHISNQLHTCQHLDVKKNRNAQIQCQLCNNKFTTLCTFHDHFIKCGNSGSYIFDYPNFQAYPLSEFCAYFENREHLQQELREPDSISETSEITKNKTIFKNYIDTLSEVFQQMRDKTKRSDQNVCDAAIHVSLTEDEEMQVVNKSNQKLDQSKEDSQKKTNKSNTGGKDKTGCGSNINTQTSGYKQTTNKTKKNLLKSEGQKQRKGKRKHRISSQEDVSKSKSVFKVGYKKNTSEKTNESIDNDDDVRNHLKAIEIKQEINTEDDLINAQALLAANDDGENTMDCEYFMSKKIEKVKENCENSDAIRSGDTHSKVSNNKNDIRIIKLKKKKHLKTAKKTASKSRKKLLDNLQSGKKTRKKLSKTLFQACEICGKLCESYRMNVHKIKHSTVKGFACDLCPKAYKYPKNLKTHKKLVHETARPYCCEVCGKGFIDMCGLRKHAWYHAKERPFKCEVCDAGFVAKFLLKRHMVQHTGEKALQCDLCGMRFVQSYNLKQHVSGIHRKERQFSCTECDQKFLTNYQLKCHLMKHAGVRPYKCTLCSADYIQRKELRRHMKKVHDLTLDEQTLPDSKAIDILTNQNEPTIAEEEHHHDNQASYDHVTGLKLDLPTSSVTVSEYISPSGNMPILSSFIELDQQQYQS